jgi:D-ribulokinase
MGYVFGTSACTMASTADAAFVPGVWGPYFSAMVPGLWLNEGGQSAAGAALDHLVTLHPAASEAATRAKAAGTSVTAWLAEQALSRAASPAEATRLADGIHVVPEFLGNRSPFADPGARAVIAGLTLDTSLDSLIGLYLAGLTGLGYGCRQIVAAMAKAGIDVDTIVISGGAGASPLVRQVLADSTDVAVAATSSPEPVLLGSAMLGAVAAGHHPDLMSAMGSMSAMGATHQPTSALARWHADRFAAFEALQSTQRLLAGQSP